VDLELTEEVLDMGPDGREGQLQLRGDRLGGLPGGKQPQDLALAGGEGQGGEPCLLRRALSPRQSSLRPYG